MNVLIGVKVAIIEFERKNELFFVAEESKLSRLVKPAVEAVDNKGALVVSFLSIFQFFVQRF